MLSLIIAIVLLLFVLLFGVLFAVFYLRYDDLLENKENKKYKKTIDYYEKSMKKSLTLTLGFATILIIFSFIGAISLPKDYEYYSILSRYEDLIDYYDTAINEKNATIDLYYYKDVVEWNDYLTEKIDDIGNSWDGFFLPDWYETLHVFLIELPDDLELVEDTAYLLYKH